MGSVQNGVQAVISIDAVSSDKNFKHNPDQPERKRTPGRLCLRCSFAFRLVFIRNSFTIQAGSGLISRTFRCKIAVFRRCDRFCSRGILCDSFGRFRVSRLELGHIDRVGSDLHCRNDAWNIDGRHHRRRCYNWRACRRRFRYADSH